MSSKDRYVFPEDFMWGAACSAFQLEGASYVDGKTANIEEQAFEDPKRKFKFQDDRTP